MSMETLQATSCYMMGEFYGVIDVYGMRYPSDFGGITMLATSYLAIGDFMKFQLVMEYYLDDNSLITKMPDGQTKEEAFYFGYQWYKTLKNQKALQELHDYYKEKGYLEKREHTINDFFELSRLADNLKRQAYNLLQKVDVLDCMAGLYHMEVVENIGCTSKASMYCMKRRLLNVLASSIEGPSVEVFESGMMCIKKLEDEAVAKETEEEY